MKNPIRDYWSTITPEIEGEIKERCLADKIYFGRGKNLQQTINVETKDTPKQNSSYWDPGNEYTERYERERAEADRMCEERDSRIDEIDDILVRMETLNPEATFKYRAEKEKFLREEFGYSRLRRGKHGTPLERCTDAQIGMAFKRNYHSLKKKRK